MEWISVADRLPKKGNLVLVWNNGMREPRIRMYGIDNDWYDERRRSTMNIHPAKEYITHWMPLPEPPKESLEERIREVLSEHCHYDELMKCSVCSAGCYIRVVVRVFYEHVDEVVVENPYKDWKGFAGKPQIEWTECIQATKNAIKEHQNA